MGLSTLEVQVQAQAQALYNFLKCLSPSTSTHMKYLCTFKHMTPLINTFY